MFVLLYLFVFHLAMSNVANLHSEFADEGCFGYFHMEVDLGGIVMSVGYTTGDDCGGIATSYCGVDVETVDIPVALLQSVRKHMQMKHHCCAVDNKFRLFGHASTKPKYIFFNKMWLTCMFAFKKHFKHSGTTSIFVLNKTMN